jgi:hypothetical protein
VSVSKNNHKAVYGIATPPTSYLYPSAQWEITKTVPILSFSKIDL